ncbi:MAG: Ig-like domain-containing protein [Candidatus Binatia bacterium]|nr:Ig-like domain-containing protein [Candidatus Binatia bacterium]
MQSKRMISARVLGAAFAVVVGLGLLLVPVAFAANRLAVALNDDPRLDDILIQPSPLTLGPGENAQLTAIGVYEDDTTADLTDVVEWTSRDTDVVTVSATGLVTAIGPGDTDIEVVEPESGTSASEDGEVIVAEIDSVSVSPATATVVEGDTLQLTATATLSDGRTGYDVTDFVRWTSGKVATATVSDTAGTKGLATAHQNGEVLIRAKDLESGNQSPNSEGVITVIEVAPTPTPSPIPTPGQTPSPTPDPGPTPTAVPTPSITQIHLVPLQLNLLPNGATGAIQAIATLSDGTQRDVSSEVVWESNRDHIAGIAAGVVTAGESGSAEIHAHHEASGIDADTKADVWVGEADSLSVSPAGAQVAVGSAVQLSAVRVYDNGLTEDITATATWHSEKDRVATVSDAAGTKGLVSGHERGDAVIIATDPVSGDETDSESGRVEVIDPVPTPTPTQDPSATPTPTPIDLGEVDEINLVPLKLDLLPTGTHTLRAIATMEDGSEIDVTAGCIFESDKERVATVAGAGIVTAVEAGKTKIDAYHPASGKDARKKARIWVGEVESIDISPTGVSVLLGDTKPLLALATYDNGLNEDITDTAEWSSEKARVATVSDGAGSKGFVTGVSRGDAVIVARDPASGKKSKSSSGKVVVFEEGEEDPGDIGTDISYTIGLRDIVLDPASLNLMPGETAFVTATGIYADGSTRDLTEFVKFDSRRSKTAEVDEFGVVTAERGGDTEIRVKEPQTRIKSRVSTRVHVAEMTFIETWPREPLLAPGERIQLLAFASYDNGVEGVDVTGEVKWSSTRTSVAEVEREAPDFGLLTAIGVGETDVTAQHLVTKVKSDRDAGLIRVTLAGAPSPTPTPAPTPTPDPGAPAVVVGQSYTPETIVLQDGETAQIVTSLHYSDGSSDVVNTGLDYGTGDFRVAVVDVTGRVVAKGMGVTHVQITDSVNGFSGTVTVAVREITSLAISPASTGLRVDGSAALEAIATFSDGEIDVDVTNAVEWKSSNPAIASVDENGHVTAHAEGSVRIEVLDRGTRVRSDASTGNVSVVGTLVRVFLTPSRLALPVGGEKNYKAFGVFADGSTIQISDEVQWSIDAGLPPLATISESGRVTAHALGDATVHATDLLTGISSSDSDGSRSLSVVGDLIGIRVSTNTDLTADPPDVVLSAGETKSLKGAGQYAGRVDAFSLGSKLDWVSSDPVAVSVSGSGLVTCQTVGASIISATDPDTGISSAATLGDLVVTCSGQVLGIRTTPDFRDLDYLSTRQLRAYRMLEDGSEIEVTRKVLWTSSDPSIASVIETGGDGGLATAVGDGEVTLLAYDAAFDVSSSASGQVSVIRTRKTRVLLELFPEDDGVGFVGNVGATYGFQARVTYVSGATQGVNLLLTWTSSDPAKVLMGDGSGAFKVNQGQLLAPGTITVTGTYPVDAASATELSVDVVFQVLP